MSIAPLITIVTAADGKRKISGPNDAVRDFLSRIVHSRAVCPIAVTGSVLEDNISIANALLGHRRKSIIDEIQVSTCTQQYSDALSIRLDDCQSDGNTVMLIVQLHHSCTADAQLLEAIFMLTHVVIMNASRRICASDVSNLSSYVDSLTQKTSDADIELFATRDALGTIAPKLMLLVHDAFELSHSKSNEKMVDGDVYLEGELDPSHPSSQVDVDRRRGIREVFPRRNCYTFPMIKSDVTFSRDVEPGCDKPARVRRNYFDAKNQFAKLMLTTVFHPKVIMGRKLNGYLFLEVIDIVVDALNKRRGINYVYRCFDDAARMKHLVFYEASLAEWEISARAILLHLRTASPHSLLVRPRDLRANMSHLRSITIAAHAARAATDVYSTTTMLEKEIDTRIDAIIVENNKHLDVEAAHLAKDFMTNASYKSKSMLDFEESYNSVGVKIAALTGEFIADEHVMQLINKHVSVKTCAFVLSSIHVRERLSLRDAYESELLSRDECLKSLTLELKAAYRTIETHTSMRRSDKDGFMRQIEATYNFD